MKVAIIPARGGSKRIPRKNIKDFNGKPIISWVILAAQKTKLFGYKKRVEWSDPMHVYGSLKKEVEVKILNR